MEKKRRVGFEIKTVSNMIKRRIINSPTVAETDKMTGMHGWIIGYLYDRRDKEDIFQRDLENDFTIRRSTVTGILQLMEKNGLIIREPVDYDKRLKKLTLTPKAIAKHEALMKEIDTIEACITNGLSEEDVNTLFIILDKIKKNLE
jgi:DNA-binding MarR family transcriptional regulator